MTLAPHTIHPAQGSKKTSRRLGRGHGTGRGKSAGRGTKGQRARTGGKSRTSILAFKKMLQKIPKSRGFHSLAPKKETVTLATLERIAANGDTVTPMYLKHKGVVGTPEYGVKILGTGELKKKLTVKGCIASKTAMAAIEKAGGSIVF
jgi:large subunit ribosomal protein L15